MTTTTAQRMVPLLDEGFDALERDDVDAFIAMVEKTAHPDCEFTSAVGSEVEGRTYVGPEAMRAWFSDFVETADLTYRDREYRPVGEDVLVFLARLEMRGRGSGATVNHEVGTVFEYEDGLARKAVSYLSHAEALAAAEALVA